MWKDASNQRDLKERIRDCIACGYIPPSKASFDLHRRTCEKCSKRALAIGDFIECPYCEYSSSILSHHLKKVHQIDNKTAKEKGVVTHSLNMRKRNGDAVKKSILSSPEERNRRSKLLGELNKTPAFRNRASVTAIKTSARKDILEQRTTRLKEWRKDNPEEFRTKCWEKMLKAPKQWKKTKPEKWIQRWLQKEYPDTFEWGKMLRSKIFKESGKSDRKQIDFRSKARDIYIEIDGPYHFENMTRKKNINNPIISEAIERTIIRDRATEKVMKNRNKCFIRIGYSCWADSTGKINQKTLDKVKEIIDNKQVGIFKLGEDYGEDNCMRRDW